MIIWWYETKRGSWSQILMMMMMIGFDTKMLRNEIKKNNNKNQNCYFRLLQDKTKSKYVGVFSLSLYNTRCHKRPQGILSNCLSKQVYSHLWLMSNGKKIKMKIKIKIKMKMKTELQSWGGFSLLKNFFFSFFPFPFSFFSSVAWFDSIGKQCLERERERDGREGRKKVPFSRWFSFSIFYFFYFLYILAQLYFLSLTWVGWGNT